MQFLDINGVRRFKQYTDDTFVTSEDVSEVEDVESSNFYTKSQVDEKLCWTAGTGEDSIVQKISTGNPPVATGPRAIAEGVGSQAKGDYSHAAGFNTITCAPHEFACGRYNNSTLNSIFSVGIGTSSYRRNAIMIQSDGDMYITNVGGSDGINGNTIQEVLDFSRLTLDEWVQIIPDRDDSSTGISRILIDDFPEGIESYANEHGFDSEEAYIEYLCDNFDNLDYGGVYGANIFLYTGETLTYGKTSYEIWQAFLYNNGLDGQKLYGFLPITANLDTLFENSLEHNINERYCPFTYMVGGDADLYDADVVYHEDNDSQFTLICAR